METSKSGCSPSVRSRSAWDPPCAPQPAWLGLAGLTIVTLGCESSLTFTRSEVQSVCGDGIVIVPETCDDANEAEGDGCSDLCLVEAGWVCLGEPSTCTPIPKPTVCQDGIAGPGEECDEGEATSRCDIDCTYSECGDGLVNRAAGETCDDGNLESLDGCAPTCQIETATCGDDRCEGEDTCANCVADCGDEPLCKACDDGDGDGYQDAACGGLDCNDSNSAVRPGAVEILCNRRDDDCDPTTSDDAVRDADGDGYNDQRCGGLDCDDSDASINPDATELVCTGVDEDCDETTPDALDEDGDGANCLTDCDDGNPEVSPSVSEVCGNGIDDDCNAKTPDVFDADGDGSACDVDCDDRRDYVCPTCVELCNNRLDDDCNPATEDVGDQDGDGFVCTADCDDARPDVNPDAAEVCGNGIDDDCDPGTDDLYDRDRDGDRCDTDCDDDDAARASSFPEQCGNAIDDDCDPTTPDLEDRDGDLFTCDVDCDDTDTGIVPDGAFRCGPHFLYEEDFESGDGGWVASGTASSWEYGRPADRTINSAASGTRAWVTDLTNDYNRSEQSTLTSPPFDLSGVLTEPLLSFQLFVLSEARTDTLTVEVSRDGGGTWAAVGGWPSANWHAADERGFSGASSGWRRASARLPGVAGRSDVRVRFRLDADSSVQREGFAIDDVRLDNQTLDVGLESGADGRETLCAGDTFAFRVRNLGALALPGFTVQYGLQGADRSVITVADLLVPGEAYDATIPVPAMTSPGRPWLDIQVNATGDSVTSNDALTPSLLVQPLVALEPSSSPLYLEDFEATDGGWVARGENPSWAWGEPASATFIGGAASGRRAVVTNLTGNYRSSELSWLLSPCFDASALTDDPTFSFAQIFQLESGFDFVWVEARADGTWRKVGRRGAGMNWYNQSSQDWSGTSGDRLIWREASSPLTGWAGQPRIQLRFFLKTDSSITRDGFGVDDVRILP